jgi:small subunit ribosomal protein S11
VEVYIKGIGGGRKASILALANKGINIDLVKDVTPIPHNGPRPPKPRRI